MLARNQLPALSVASPLVVSTTDQEPANYVLRMLAAGSLLAALVQPEAAECVGTKRKKGTVVEEFYEVDCIKAVTTLSVTGQIPGSHHGWNPPPAWRARPARCTNGRANTPRQFGHAEECESEWSMDWVMRRNTRHVGGRGGVLCTSKSVS